MTDTKTITVDTTIESNIEEESPDEHHPRRSITLSLLRKRSEHNEGLISNLEEIALHQENLECIGVSIGKTCGKTLQILLLQNNVISELKKEEMKWFRSLKYLNLALNNLTCIGSVSAGSRDILPPTLEKLDLTLNFISLDHLECLVMESLKGLSELRELFLIGNPCMTKWEQKNDDDQSETHSSQHQHNNHNNHMNGCRSYVIANLPQLHSLDGIEILRSERILATQKLPSLQHELRQMILQQQQKEKTKIRHSQNNINDNDMTQHTPEMRLKLSNETYHQLQEKEKLEQKNQPRKRGEYEFHQEQQQAMQNSKKLIHNDDNNININIIKQTNQGKFVYTWKETRDFLHLNVETPRFLSTSLIDVDVHPTYLTIIIKSKVLRLKLPCEVLSDKSKAERSQANGHLCVKMPKLNPREVITYGNAREEKEQKQELCTVSSSSTKNNTTKMSDLMLQEISSVWKQQQENNDNTTTSCTSVSDSEESDDEENILFTPPPVF